MADLTVTLTEAIKLQNNNQGATVTKTISGVNEVDRRIVTVLTSTNGNEIIKTAGAAGAGTYIPANVKYIRITNLDSTNYVVLFLSDGGHHALFKLEAGKSFILGTPVGFDDVDDIDNFSAATISTIQAKANTASVKLEVFVASA